MTVVPGATAGAVLAVLLSVSAHSETRPEFFVAKLENGVTVGFALVRTGAQQPGVAPGEVVYPRSSGLSRVLFDEAQGVYFGYRLDVDRSDKRLKVTIRALGGDVARELRDRSSCRGCQAPTLLASALARIPAPLTLADGDVLTLELMSNSSTGEKLIDVVKLSTRPFDDETMRSAADHILEALRAAQRADILAARGTYDEAAKEYRRSLELNPKDASVLNRLGMCYQQLRQPGRAEEQYRQAVRVNPRYAKAWNNLGSVAHSAGDFKQAIKHYQKAVALDPSSATTYRNMGAAYFALGQLEQCLKAWEAALRIDPSISESTSGSSVTAGGGPGLGEQYLYFAKIAAMNGQVERACGFLRQAQTAGFTDWKRVEKDSTFDAVARHPCYQELRGTRKPKK